MKIMNDEHFDGLSHGENGDIDEFSVDAILGSIASDAGNAKDEKKSEKKDDAANRTSNKPQKSDNDGEIPVARRVKEDGREEVRAVSDNPDKKPKKKKKKSKKGLPGWAGGLIIVAISLLLAFSAIMFSCEIMGIGKEVFTGDKSVQIYVEEGTSVSEIASMLKENKVVISKNFFLLYLKVKKEGGNFNYGYHDFKQNMGYKQIIKALEQPAKKEDLEVTIPEGKSVDEIAEIMERKKVCLAEDFKAAALEDGYTSPLLDAVPKNDSRIHYRIEGYLFPDTYRFFENDDPKRVIQKMLDNTEEHYTDEMRQKTAELGYTTHEMMSMASVIELESCGYFNEMTSVSAVFWNRLNNWEPGQRLLQSDVTMNYPYGDGSYNTYENEGLPPGPLCNVTAQAMNAAVYPEEDFDYYFFVTDSKFRFYYNKTVSEHEKTIRSLKSKGLWLG